MHVDTVIVGGGPVGLYLAAALLQEDLTVRVLERRETRDRHSRAIGIHPPALAALDRVGLARPMVREGVPIREGLAVSAGKTVGAMPFHSVSDTFPFVLALPQCRTEELLEERVRALDSEALVKGAEAAAVKDDGGRVAVAYGPAGGAATAGGVLTASVVVAADGARSRIREKLGVPFRRKDYPDHYLMGDFADTGDYGAKAVLFLEPGGIVESFPLPGSVRRWVVRLGKPAVGATPHRLAGLVAGRTGVYPDPDTSSMLSAFSVRAALVRRMVAGRVVLVGDAAHEISPIGGQGMNLGWFDAQALAPLIIDSVLGRHSPAAYREYEVRRLRAAAQAKRQSEINMFLGRPLPVPLLRLRNSAIGAAAAAPAVNGWVAGRFTMRQEGTEDHRPASRLSP